MVPTGRARKKCVQVGFAEAEHPARALRAQAARARPLANSGRAHACVPGGAVGRQALIAVDGRVRALAHELPELFAQDGEHLIADGELWPPRG